MKITKKILVISMILSIVLSSVTAFATPQVSDVVVKLQIDNSTMELNGIDTEIDPGRNTKPVVLNDRTLVPIRAIIEAFGGSAQWQDSTQTVLLTMDDVTIELVINSTTAYLNHKPQTLDVAPTVINDRTMLPIRFVAEGFNLGVAWDESTRTVSIIRNLFDEAEYEYLMSVLPAYNGSPYCIINDNVPLFKDYEIIPASFEYYSNLDELGRCDVCMASVAPDLMPTQKRGSISSVTPTGWINAEYDVVNGRYLYNRCHLIGYQLTGENANPRNLITGTRYLNVDGMLPFENMIDTYIDQTANHVMYRSTPVFSGSNLLADGVLLEAYSVEDAGRGISFCVFCYNVQPSINIDYATGANSLSSEPIDANPNTPNTTAVYRTPTGKKYHLDPQCGGKNSYQITLDQALSALLTPCAKCVN